MPIRRDLTLKCIAASRAHQSFNRGNKGTPVEALQQEGQQGRPGGVGPVSRCTAERLERIGRAGSVLRNAAFLIISQDGVSNAQSLYHPSLAARLAAAANAADATLFT